MMELAALVALLAQMSETYHGLGDLCAETAALLDHNVVDEDALMLARAIQGEEAGIFGENRNELATWIAHTAVNRWEKPWWKEIDGVPCTFSERVEYDWHGVALVKEKDLEPWAIRIAHEVLDARRVGGPDRANGALFAMSSEDLFNHGWMEYALQVGVNIILCPDDPGVRYWFMTDDPAKGGAKQ